MWNFFCFGITWYEEYVIQIFLNHLVYFGCFRTQKMILQRMVHWHAELRSFLQPTIIQFFLSLSTGKGFCWRSLRYLKTTSTTEEHSWLYCFYWNFVNQERLNSYHRGRNWKSNTTPGAQRSFLAGHYLFCRPIHIP